MTAELHRRLATLNHHRFRPGLPDPDWRGALAREHELRLLEGELVERERAALAAQAAEAPTDAAGFDDLVALAQPRPSSSQ